MAIINTNNSFVHWDETLERVLVSSWSYIYHFILQKLDRIVHIQLMIIMLVSKYCLLELINIFSVCWDGLELARHNKNTSFSIHNLLSVFVRATTIVTASICCLVDSNFERVKGAT